MTAPKSDPTTVSYSGLLSGSQIAVDVHDLSVAGGDSVLLRFTAGPIAISLEGTLQDLLDLNVRLAVRLGETVLARQERRAAGSDFEQGTGPESFDCPDVAPLERDLSALGARLRDQTWPVRHDEEERVTMPEPQDPGL